MKASEANKISCQNNLGPFCSFTQDVYKFIEEQARSGISNTFIVVPEESLYSIKKELRENGYNVFSTDLKKTKHNATLYKEKYKEYVDLYELEIEWQGK